MNKPDVAKTVEALLRTGRLEEKVWKKTEQLDMAVDFAQEAATRVLEMDPEKFQDAQAVENMAFAVLRNLTIDRWRENERQQLEYGELADREDVAHINEHTWTEHTAQLEQLTTAIEKAAQELSIKQREAVYQKLKGETPAEGAQHLGARLVTHKTNLFRAIRKLRKLLSKAGYEWSSQEKSR
jgi:RNA polymerase sigma factor (sigma-70 family)